MLKPKCARIAEKITWYRTPLAKVPRPQFPFANEQLHQPLEISPMSTSKPMASTTSLLAEDPQKSILEDGVFYAEDPVIGKRVDDIAQNGFPFRTEEGLDFCKLNALDDKASKETDMCKGNNQLICSTDRSFRSVSSYTWRQTSKNLDRKCQRRLGQFHRSNQASSAT